MVGRCEPSSRTTPLAVIIIIAATAPIVHDGGSVGGGLRRRHRDDHMGRDPKCPLVDVVESPSTVAQNTWCYRGLRDKKSFADCPIGEGRILCSLSTGTGAVDAALRLVLAAVRSQQQQGHPPVTRCRRGTSRLCTRRASLFQSRLSRRGGQCRTPPTDTARLGI